MLPVQLLAQQRICGKAYAGRQEEKLEQMQQGAKSSGRKREQRTPTPTTSDVEDEDAPPPPRQAVNSRRGGGRSRWPQAAGVGLQQPPPGIEGPTNLPGRAQRGEATDSSHSGHGVVLMDAPRSPPAVCMPPLQRAATGRGGCAAHSTHFSNEQQPDAAVQPAVHAPSQSWVPPAHPRAAKPPAAPRPSIRSMQPPLAPAAVMRPIPVATTTEITDEGLPAGLLQLHGRTYHRPLFVAQLEAGRYSLQLLRMADGQGVYCLVGENFDLVGAPQILEMACQRALRWEASRAVGPQWGAAPAAWLPGLTPAPAYVPPVLLQQQMQWQQAQQWQRADLGSHNAASGWEPAPDHSLTLNARGGNGNGSTGSAAMGVTVHPHHAQVLASHLPHMQPNSNTTY